jgi:O-antigen/teichoic acid export membrane protein
MISSFLFKNKTTAQTIAKNTFWLLAGEAVSRTIRAVVVIYAARILGTAGYGAFAFAMAIANFAAIFADLGVTSIVGREVSKNPAARAQYFANALALKGIMLTLNVGIILFAIPMLVKIPAALPLLPLIAALLIFDTLRDFAMAFFRALERMEWDALVKTLTNICIAVIGISSLKIIGTAYALTSSYIIGAIFGLFVAVIILFTHSRSWFAPIQKGLIKNIAVTSWPIGLLALAGAFSINTDMIMLGWLTPPEVVGLYAAAQRPIQLLYVFPGLIASAMFPVMARLARKDDKRLGQMVEQGSKVTLMLALPITLGGIILTPGLINFIYGAAYTGANLSFQILLLTLLVMFPFAVVNYTILAYDRQAYFVRFFLLGALLNIGFNLLLIPQFGIAGAAVATVVAQFASNWLTLRSIKKLNPISITKGIGKIIIAALVMTLITWALARLDTPTFINLGLSMVAYLGALLALREPIFKELRAVIKPEPTNI